MNVLEIVETILDIMQSPLKPIILNDSKGEIEAQYLDSKKANDLLGWKPKFNLSEGLKYTIDWYQSFFKQQKLQGCE
jgi:nucleoside-diphosphate-sugar epimerase